MLNNFKIWAMIGVGVISISCTSDEPKTTNNLSIATKATHAPQILDPVDWSFSKQDLGDNEFELQFTATIDPHWHVYSQFLEEDGPIPTSFSFKESKDFKLIGKVKEPKALEDYDPNFQMTLKWFENSVTFRQKIKVLKEGAVKILGELEFMVCDDKQCLAPEYVEYEFELVGKAVENGNPTTEPANENNGNGDTEEQATKDSADSSRLAISDSMPVDSGSAPISVVENETNNNQEEERSIWGILLLAFLSGLAALLTPCVFPMIPMTVSYFTKQSKNKASAIKNAGIYGLSIIAIFTLMGSLVSLLVDAKAIYELSTSWGMNLFFFAIILLFALSFLGAFELTLPSSWINKADKQADKGGLLGTFFLALVLVLVSFTCTGPIVGSLLVEMSTVGGITPILGMLSFSIALALPFMIFSMVPGWLNSMPKSGGWLNQVKVTLGMLELALAFKFLSMVDIALNGKDIILGKELFLGIHAAILIMLGMYLLGMFKMPHDSDTNNPSVIKYLFAFLAITFGLYMGSGMLGAPVKLIAGYPPAYGEITGGMIGGNSGGSEANSAKPNMDLVPGFSNLYAYHDYGDALEQAKKEQKPIVIDFTGYSCANCRRMEQNVWSDPAVMSILKNDVILVSLHVDDPTKLSEEEQKEVIWPGGKKKKLRDIGDIWIHMQVTRYLSNSQPLYVFQDSNGNDIPIGMASYESHGSIEKFKSWLDSGFQLLNKES